MMRKMFLMILLSLCASCAWATGANIVLCPTKGNNCQIIQFDNRQVERISGGTIVSITFAYWRILDMRILGKTFEIKKGKKAKGR